MAIYKVNDFVVNGFVEEADEDIVVMGICISGGERQQIKFLKEFLSCFRTLSQQRQLVLSIGLLVGILEGFFTFLAKIGERPPPGETHSDDLVNEVGRELLW